MATSQEQLLAIGGVLAILVGTMVVTRMLAARQAQAARSAPGFVGKYAHHAGAVVGKVVAQEGDMLVVEQGGVRRRVPLAAAREQGDDVVLAQEPA